VDLQLKIVSLKWFFYSLILFSFLPSVSFEKGVGTAVLTCEVECMDGSAEKGKTAKGGALIVHG